MENVTPTKYRNELIIEQLRISAGARPLSDPKMQVKRLAAELSAAMASLHGGDWRVQIDHQVGLIVIAKRLARTR